MGLIGQTVLILLGCAGAILIAVLGRLGADEFKAWTPRFVEKLLELALNRLPDKLRDRYAEEWRADLNDTPGDVARLATALSFWRAASRIRSDEKRGNVGVTKAQRCLAAGALLFMLPWILLVPLLIILIDRVPPFRRDKTQAGSFLLYNCDGRVGDLLRRSQMEYLPVLISVVGGRSPVPINKELVFSIVRSIFLKEE